MCQDFAKEDGSAAAEANSSLSNSDMAAKENSTIERIENIGDVEEEKSNEESSTSDKGCGVQLNDVHVVRVVHLDSYNGCIKCNAKLIPDEEDTDLGQCVKCKMMQCMEVVTWELSVQLVVKSAGRYNYPLSIWKDGAIDIV